VVAAAPVRTPLARIASDHFPLLAEVRIKPRPDALAESAPVTSATRLEVL
jgi:hypothetical protein